MLDAEGKRLSAEALSKSFSGVPVLRGVSFSLAPGQTLGLVGENGAGKSTLMNLLGGVLRPDSGRMLLDGAPYAPASAREAAARGVAFVHQELNLFPNLTIAENVFLAGFPLRAGFIDRRKANKLASALLERVGLALPPETPVERLSQAERQLVEIAKALNLSARVVIFDEPTTSLAPPEVKSLFTIIGQLNAAGIAVIYISHTLEDVLRLADRIVVLRDGEVAGDGRFSASELVTLMVGRPVDRLFPPRTSAPSRQIVLEARGLSQPSILAGVSFRLHKGEVLGLAGLMGSGRSELARILFGLDERESGEILLEGRRVGHLTPALGAAFLTENRREDGLLMDGSVTMNLTTVTPLPRRVPEVIAAVRLRAANLDRQPVRQLSGGNQQKVVLGKWIMGRPKVFVLDEPTRGIDVGAKLEIYRVIDELAAAGAGLLVISSEIEELIGICDRILVMRRGETGGEFERGEFDRERILRAAL